MDVDDERNLNDKAEATIELLKKLRREIEALEEKSEQYNTEKKQAYNELKEAESTFKKAKDEGLRMKDEIVKEQIEAQVKMKEREREALESEMAKLKDKLQGTEEEKGIIESRIQELEQQVEALPELDEWNTEKASLIDEISDLTTQEATLIAAINDLIKRLKQFELQEIALTQSEKALRDKINTLNQERDSLRRHQELTCGIRELIDSECKEKQGVIKEVKLLCQQAHNLISQSANSNSLRKQIGLAKLETKIKQWEDGINSQMVRCEEIVRKLKGMKCMDNDELRGVKREYEELCKENEDFAERATVLGQVKEFEREVQGIYSKVNTNKMKGGLFGLMPQSMLKEWIGFQNAKMYQELLEKVRQISVYENIENEVQQRKDCLEDNKSACKDALNSLSAQQREARQLLQALSHIIDTFNTDEDCEVTLLQEKLNASKQELSSRINEIQDSIDDLYITFFEYFAEETSLNSDAITSLSQSLLQRIYELSNQIQECNEEINSLSLSTTSMASLNSDKQKLMHALRKKMHDKQSQLSIAEQTLEKAKLSLELVKDKKELQRGISKCELEISNQQQYMNQLENQLKLVSSQPVAIEDLQQMISHLDSLDDLSDMIALLSLTKGKAESLAKEDQAKCRDKQLRDLFQQQQLHRQALSKDKVLQDLLIQGSLKLRSLPSEAHDFTSELKKLQDQQQNLAKRIQDGDNLAEVIAAQKKVEENIRKLIADMKEFERKQQEKSKIEKELNDRESKLKNYVENSLPEAFNEIQRKLDEAQALIRNIEKIGQAMIESIEYAPRRVSLEKVLESNAELKVEQRGISEQLSKLKSIVTSLKQERGRLTSVEAYDELISKMENQSKRAEDIDQEVEVLISSAKRLRFKLGQADIPDLLKQKRAQLSEVGRNLQAHESELRDLMTALEQHPEAIQQLLGLKKLLQQVAQDKSIIDLRLKNLSNKVQGIDLLHADGQTIVSYVKDLSEIGQLLNQRQIDMENAQKQISFIGAKYLGLDLAKKFESLLKQVTVALERITKLKLTNVELQELCDEFTGYCSDDNEQELINRLQSAEIKEGMTLLRILTEKNESLSDKLQLLQIQLQKEKNSQTKAQALADIESELSRHSRDVADAERRISGNMRAFDRLNGRDKVGLRERELDELERRLGQIDIMLQRIEEESQSESERVQDDQSKAKIISEMQDIRRECGEMRNDIGERMTKSMNEARGQLLQLQRDMASISNQEVLKRSKRLKKMILDILKQVKQLKTNFNNLRGRYEGCKLKLKTLPKYKPLVGDDVDRMIADWIFANCCPIPINRIGNGYYQFGQKKIYAKITNGKLVIRVGGGYMGIDEFMYYYGAQELNKMLAYEGFSIDEEIDLEKIFLRDEPKGSVINKFNDGKTVVGSQQFKKRFSPSRGSVRQSEASRSPKATHGSFQLNMSPGRAQTPSVTHLLKPQLKRSSQGIGSPKSNASNQLRTTDTGFNKASTPLIRHIAPSNIQGRRSPKQTDVGASSYNDAGYLSVPKAAQIRLSDFGLAEDDTIPARNGRISAKLETVSTLEVKPFRGDIEENSTEEPKSRILELIKERKAQLSKVLRKQ